MPIDRSKGMITRRKTTRKMTIITGIISIPNHGMFHHSDAGMAVLLNLVPVDERDPAACSKVRQHIARAFFTCPKGSSKRRCILFALLERGQCLVFDRSRPLGERRPQLGSAVNGESVGLAIIFYIISTGLSFSLAIHAHRNGIGLDVLALLCAAAFSLLATDHSPGFSKIAP